MPPLLAWLVCFAWIETHGVLPVDRWTSYVGETLAPGVPFEGPQRPKSKLEVLAARVHLTVTPLAMQTGACACMEGWTPPPHGALIGHMITSV